GTAAATETAIGFVPTVDGIDISGLQVTTADIAELVKVDKALWKDELELIKEQQVALGDRLPNELKLQVEELEARLG
ncbi:MAG TPA: phosphoenolpyruvate carboxykinase domain-containing protein, partial [Prolixibacteraceae bacterium]|nr:phosphoenolpyruvate carboxykinase domain-containing protein [Prolixibacteraceae bacterium]